MKICPVCNNSIPDDAEFCANCGTKVAAQPNTYTVPPQQNYAPNYAQNYAPAYDHTAEFDAKDVSDNKVIAMLVYLLGAVGIIIALLVGNDSPYAAFHVRQALKITVVNTLLTIITTLLCWTVIVPFAASLLILALTVIKFICFFQVCNGKAEEPAIIRSLNFLK